MTPKWGLRRDHARAAGGISAWPAILDGAGVGEGEVAADRVLGLRAPGRRGQGVGRAAARERDEVVVVLGRARRRARAEAGAVRLRPVERGGVGVAVGEIAFLRGREREE